MTRRARPAGDRFRRVAALALLAFACSSPTEPAEPTPAPGFPTDYAANYAEARDCRKSADHELDFVRVLTDPASTVPYTGRATPFPDGGVVLKEQYDIGDATCAGPIVSWTVMTKHAAATDRLGWDWQRVAADRRVLETNGGRCISCHSACSGTPEVGYDYTCEEP